MFSAKTYPVEVVELKSVERDLDSALHEAQKTELIDWLAMNPEAGEFIKGTNGVRKARWRYGNKGKRSGIRIVYYFRDLNMPIYLLAVYLKGEKESLSKGDKKEISALVDALVREHCARLERAGVIDLNCA